MLFFSRKIMTSGWKENSGHFFHKIRQCLKLDSSFHRDKLIKTTLLPFHDKLALLDLGCDPHSPLYRALEKNGSYWIGVDLNLEYLRKSKHVPIHDDYICADVRFLPFRRKCVDVTLALEIVEHMAKRDGETFLNTLECLTRSLIIVSTPNGYRPQYPVSNTDAYQAHLSSWSTTDFKSRGYIVVGWDGPRFLRDLAFKAVGRTYQKPRNVMDRLVNSMILFPLELFRGFYKYPPASRASQLFCIKKMSK